jgi:hypothetical protein
LDKLASNLQSSYTENPGESTKTANIGPDVYSSCL